MSISFWFLSDFLRLHFLTRLKSIFRFSYKSYMAHINKILLKSCLLNKRWLLHGIYCIHIKFKSMSEVRSLAQIQTPKIQSSSQVYSSSKVNWLRSTIDFLIRFLGTKFHIINHLLRLWIHRISKLLTAPLRRLVTFHAQIIKSLRPSNLESISAALLNILCDHIFVFFLNYWQMYIKSTWFIFFLIFFNSSFCFRHLLNLSSCNLFHLLHGSTNLTKTTFFCVINLNWLEFALVFLGIVRWIRWRLAWMFQFFLFQLLLNLNSIVHIW